MTTYVYFIQMAGRKTAWAAIKIGVAYDPRKRLAGLQTANPRKLRLLLAVPFDERKRAYDLEQELHSDLKDFRIRGEWFGRSILKTKQMRKIFKGSPGNPMLRVDGGMTDLFQD